VERAADVVRCKYRKKRKPPIILASLGCFFAHLSYSLRTARLASSFFIAALDRHTIYALCHPFTIAWRSLMSFGQFIDWLGQRAGMPRSTPPWRGNERLSRLRL